MADEKGVYVADWGGNLYRIGFGDGGVLARLSTGDVVDAAPTLTPPGEKPLVAAQNWARKLFLLDRETLAVKDVHTDEPGPADDHRQSSPIFSGGKLIVGTWSGKIEAYDTAGGKLSKLWTLDAGSPIRAGLATDGKAIFAASSGGLLLALNNTGEELWRKDFGDPLLSTPLLNGELLLVGTRGGSLYALETATGGEKWRAKLCGAAWYAPAETDGGLYYQGVQNAHLLFKHPGRAG